MKSKRVLFLIYYLIVPVLIFAQGRNNNWLVGYNSGITPPFNTCERAKIYFPSGNISIQPMLNSKMNFLATEGNISDKNGNLLISSNGYWIANAFGDTMLNGTGLNPGALVNASSNCHCINMFNSNLILPFPSDSNKYILFHTIANYNASLSSTELFYTIVDMNLDGGLGGITLKNQIAFQDTLMWAISAVKHANGRDWWVLMIKDNSDKIFKVLVTPNGIESVTSQNVGGIRNYHTSVGQSVFSSDGKKFAYSSVYIDTSTFNNISNLRLFDFDRCSGLLSNYRNYATSNYYASVGVSFSNNSQYLYAATVHNILQINTNSLNPTVDTVAINDGYFSPVSPFQTDFYTMYLADDGRIYSTSGNGVLDIHYINYPDSAGLACDVHQHALHLPCFNARSIPNHPNYELGADSGSVCDTLQLTIKNLDFRKQKSIIQINPNPVEDYFYINYDLNVRDNALFVLYNGFGNEVLRRSLYGSMKTLLVHCEELVNGVYFYTSTVRNKIVDSGKVVVVK